MLETDLNPQEQYALDVLSKRLLLLFIVPLVVIVILGAYSYYLTTRVRQVETQAMTLQALQEWNVTERILAKEQNYTWAIQQFEALAKSHPHPQILTRLAGLYARTDPARAAVLLDTAEAAEPGFWEIYSTRHYLYAQMGEDEKAFQAGKRALELNPLDAQTHNNMAWLYATTTERTLVDLDAAAHHAQTAVQFTRERNAEYLDTLARIQAQRGDITKARHTIHQAMQVVQRTLHNLMATQEKLGVVTENASPSIQ